MEWWRANVRLLTLGLTLLVCAVGLAMGVAPIEVLGVFLFGMVLVALNGVKRKGE